MPYYRKGLQDIANSCAGRGLLFIRSAHYLYSDVEFGQLFTDAFAAGLDVAFVDKPRLSRKTPKRAMLQQASYRIQIDDGAADWVNISGFGETRNFIYARHPS